MNKKKENYTPFENALKKALNTPLPPKEKKIKKITPWTGSPLDLNFFTEFKWAKNLFRKKPS